MKTAISIEDRLLHEADAAAKQMGLSRSRLFALAIGDFLKRQQHEKMLHQLNAVYASGMDAGEKRLVNAMKVKFRRTIKDRW
jgi:metal-responsive CopG/Arc/MetJ family transcriptional regulator